MGNQEVWEGKDLSLLNGLLPNEVSRVTRTLDADRWSLAESRIDELIKCIQPNRQSDVCRDAVVDYVRGLISNRLSCEVFTFGSVPLKTYLPDGDIDMSAFSNNMSLKDTWANEVRDVLENEEKSENAEFQVKEVQYIQAEVKIIKCLVKNIVVDISLNQRGGLATLCFLGEIDQFINQNHLFKRSIILIKAWCYYESRILGAHHGLISTYALEILVLYIFHVFNKSFSGPLEVLYWFLEFFSNFDWDNFCVSLSGPVPVSSLPDISAEPPRRDAGDLLLNKIFLDTCISRYSVSQGGQENQGQPFISKFFNVIDPLRTNNNLGRSVSKGNFFRIRSAFAFGAKRLARLLDCPADNIVSEVNMFFMNTWKRYGSDQCPDAPGSQLLNLHPSDRSFSVDEKSRNSQNNSVPRSTEIHGSTIFQEHCTDAAISSQGMYRPETSRISSHNILGNQPLPRTSDQTNRSTSVHGARSQKFSPRPNYNANESQGAARIQFSRARSSPELSDSSSVASSRKQSEIPETVKSYMTSSNSLFTATDSSDLNNSSNQSIDINFESSRGYHNDSGFIISSMDYASEALMRHQDMVNMRAFSAISGINGQCQLPMPLHGIPSLAHTSVGDPRKNLAGIRPGNIPLTNPHGGSNLHFSHGHPSPSHEGTSMRDLAIDDDNGFWPDQAESGSRGLATDRRSSQRFHSDDSHVTDNSGDSFIRGQQTFVRENMQATNDGQETYSTDAVNSSRFMANSHASSSRSRSSESSKLGRDKQGRKSTPSMSYGALNRGGSQYEGVPSVHADVDEPTEWIPPSGSSSSLHLTGLEPAQLRGPDPRLPLPMMSRYVCPPSSQSGTGDGSGVMCIGYIPFGPPFPFLTMPPPDYNYPPELGNFDGAPNMKDNVLENGHLNSSDNASCDLRENVEHSDAHSSPGSARGASFEHLEEHKGDILNSDLNSHWQNLKYARSCQDTHYPWHVVCPMPMVFSTMCLPGRPSSTDMNLVPCANYGPQLMPMESTQLGRSLQQQPGVFPRYGDEIPIYRGGTGTYLPNHKASSYTERPSSRTRNNHRGNYSYERNDHVGREGSWTSSKSSRAPNRRNNQPEKSAVRPDRPSGPDNRPNRLSNLPPSGHPSAPAPNSNGSGMMRYRYDGGRIDFRSSEQLEFVEGSRSTDKSQLSTIFDQQGSPRSSPEQPSSRVHRRGS